MNQLSNSVNPDISFSKDEIGDGPNSPRNIGSDLSRLDIQPINMKYSPSTAEELKAGSIYYEKLKKI